MAQEQDQLGSFNPRAFLDIPLAYTKQPVLFNIIQLVDISHSKLGQLYDWLERDDPNKVPIDTIKKSRDQQPSKKEENDKDSFCINFGRMAGNNVYRILLRDSWGNYCYAYEYQDKLPFLRQNQLTTTCPDNPLGARMLVSKGTLIMNGVLMLRRAQCQYLGVTEPDRQLLESLNSNLVQKYIDNLKEELKGNS